MQAVHSGQRANVPAVGPAAELAAGSPRTSWQWWLLQVEVWARLQEPRVLQQVLLPLWARETPQPVRELMERRGFKGV
jgi:hypothetical protein